MNNEVLKNLSYGVYVLSTFDNQKSTGCIVNSLIQVTHDTVLASVNHINYTNECIKKNNKFGVSILPNDIEDEVIAKFGFQSGRDIEKFENIEKTNVDGIDVIKNAIGYLICEVIDTLETQTHTLFLAKIKNGEILNEKTPMTYAYYHKVKKGKSPKAAPTYIEEKNTQVGYRCKVCKYVYEGDIFSEPADFVCPICKQPKHVFEKI